MHERFRRYREGYNGLPPRYYFYLDVGTLKNADGENIVPYWRDGDHELALWSEAARATDSDELVVKRRGYGLTSDYGGSEPVYNCLIYPGSISTITSADTFRNEDMFNNKVKVMYNGLVDRIPAEYIPEQIYDRAKGYLKLKGSRPGKGESLVVMLETADSDNACKKLEGFRAKYVFLDEIFLHPRAELVRTSAQASVMGDGFYKTGHIVMGGSCGVENEKEKQNLKRNTQMIQELVADSEAKNIKVIFIPGTMCIAKARELDDRGNPIAGKLISFMENGVSNEKKAKEWIEKTRLRLERATDKTALWTFMKNFPLTLDEVFDINKQGIFSDKIYANIAIAKKNIENGPKHKPCFLYEKDNQVLREDDKKLNCVFIGREPQGAESYIAGIDPIPFSENKIEDGSDFAGAVKSIENQTYDAYMAIRSHDANFVVGQMVLLQKLYRSTRYPIGAPAMLETNMGGVVREKYKQLGLDVLLANRPKILGEVFQDGKIVKGWHKNVEKSAPIAIEETMVFLENYGHLIIWDRLINEIRDFPTKNTDLLDAVISCEVLSKALFAELKKKTGTGRSFQQKQVYSFENGRVVKKWETIEIKD